MNNSETELRTELAAAQETIQALTKRMQLLENGGDHLPLHKQLQSYQQRIKEKSEDLKKAQHWFKLIIEYSMDAIIRLDQTGRIQSWNPMAQHMFGYCEHESLGQLIEDLLIPPRFRDSHLRAFHRHLRRGRGGLINRRIEGIAQCKDGSELAVEYIGSTVQQGDTRAFVMTFHDVSQRKIAEQALQDSHSNLESLVEERSREARSLAAIIEATSNFVGIADLQGNVFYVNPAGRRMIGLKKDIELDKLNVSDFHSPETCHTLHTEVFPQTLKQGTFETSCDFIDQHGVNIPTSSIFMVLPDQYANTDRFAVIARDKRQEISLQQQIEHVDRLESLGILAGGIAHDFNNILTAITCNAGIAAHKLDNHSPALKYLEHIEQSSLQAGNLCNQMLAYSGKGNFMIESLDLSKTVTEMRSLLEVSVDKNVSLQFDLSPTLTPIEADITQIQQIIMNLVINASEATQQENGCIIISTSNIYADEQFLQGTLYKKDASCGEFICLTISDNGCGMDSQTLKKIFDPFFTTKFTGRGLGMSAVLGIIYGHQGLLKVISQPNKGTTFEIAFPAKKSCSTSSEITPPDNSNNKQGHGTVLVIDDEETIREITCIALEEIGYSTLSAIDGQDGISVFLQHQKVIIGVVLDMTMPNMNGDVCFSELRKINPDLKVILSSGYSADDAATELQKKGLAGFIQKPYPIDRFQALTLSCFDVKQPSHHDMLS